MYSFEFNRSSLPALETKTAKECLPQWNLDASSLHVSTYRVFGPFSRSSKIEDYEQLLKDFVASAAFAEHLQPGGSCRQPVNVEYSPLINNVRSLAFFDKIKECSGVISSGEDIKGCFEETYEGIVVNDMLREMILNPDSEYSNIFSTEDKSQLLYAIFCILVIGGGGLCQPDTKIDRYLELSKDMYKDLVTICKSSQTNEVEIVSRSFKVRSVAGLELYPKNSGSEVNSTILICDSLQKTITVVQHSMNKFW